MHTDQMINPSQSHNQLRLVNTERTMMHTDNTESTEIGFSDIIAPDDKRWLLATRVQLAFNDSNRVRSIGQFEDMLEIAHAFGFSDIHARAIICIVEEAQFRNGLDHLAMTELLQIPRPKQSEQPMSNRVRWTTFGVLFGWSLMIAGLMQLV